MLVKKLIIKKCSGSISKKLIAIITSIIMLNLQLSFIFIFPNISGENFFSDIRVDDTGIDITNQTWPDVTIFENNVFVIWEDNRLIGDQRTHIYFAKSTGYTTSFGLNVRVDDAPIDDSACCPSFTVNKGNGNIYVVWQDYRNSPNPYSVDIYFANSTDGGETFNANKRVNDDIGNTFQGVPSIATGGGLIGVVWADDRGGIYFANSTDDGDTFSPNKQINDVCGLGVFYPKIVMDDNGVIYVVWEDNPDGKFYIYFSKSMDGGNTFSPQKKVNDDSTLDGQRMPSLAIDQESTIYVVWVDYIGADTNISFAKSIDGGSNFTTNKQVNDDLGSAKQYQPSIAVNDVGKIFISWLDEREGGYNIYFANSTDGGNTFSVNQKINDGPNISPVYTPSNAVAAKGNHAYIVWQDDRKGDWDIYFTRSNWEPPMATPISPPTGSKLIFNESNLQVDTVLDPDNDSVYYNFTISDQPDAESGTVYYSGWITSTSWNPPPLSDGKWYWHTYTYDGFNITPPNWVWNFIIDTTQSYSTQLYEGWNLISIPFIQMDTSLKSVLNSIDGLYNTVWWYNISDRSDYWKVNNTSKLLYMNDLDNIDHTMGFWIHITEPGGALLQCSGIIPMENQSITLKPGWNLVGYPSLSNKTRLMALNNINFSDDVDSIWTYNASVKKWEEIGDTDCFERGRGYWIHSKVEKTWEVPI